MATSNRPPPVLVSACNRTLGGHPSHTVGRKYVDAVRLAGALPLVATTLDTDEIDAALDAVHGVLLTGSKSNVHPRHYAAPLADPALPLDEARDAWVLPLVRRAVARGVPLLAICRGAQEVNVALGGSLHQAVHDVPGYADHRAVDDAAIDVQYAAAHRVDVLRGGRLERVLGAGPIDVNSVHGQGIARLAEGLRPEAVAPDGLIEAFSWVGAGGDGAAGEPFIVGVQWHPEWLAAANPLSLRLLHAWGEAVRAHRVRADRALRSGGGVAFVATVDACAERDDLDVERRMPPARSAASR